MQLGVSPGNFLGRVVVLFGVTYLGWSWLAPAYTQLLGMLSQGVLGLLETSGNPDLHRVSQIWVDGSAIHFRNRLFPNLVPPGIPAEWVQANMVLLIPLMLATPAPTWGRKAARLVTALAIAMVLQVIDLCLTVKAFHAYELGAYSARYYGDAARWFYGFADAFTQSMDTQLFPFVIWAGIHFRQLTGIDGRRAKVVSGMPRARRRSRS